MAQERAEDTIAVSNRHGLVMYRAMATTTLGWALAEHRQAESIEQMRTGLAGHRATGAEVLVSHSLALLAEVLAAAGEVEEALRVSEEALATAQVTGEGYYMAEAYRVKGEVLLLQAAHRGRSRAAGGGKTSLRPEPSVAAQAETCFRQSIQIARQQNAKSWELRAAMSMARLFRGQDKAREARDLLARIYGGFTEGFETADLRDARALLDELS
jgi:predicted ATPase